MHRILNTLFSKDGLFSGGVISLFLFCGTFVYLILRAIYVPFVHDEAATFFYFIHPFDFIPHKDSLDANNHILNSALSSFFYFIFGPSSFALRLANLLFLPIYFYYWFQLARLFSDKIIAFVFLVAGFFAHNFLEFFALSRGYGMSMALLVAGVYYLILALQTNRLKFTFLAVFLLLSAELANLALLNSLLLAFGILVQQLVRQRKTQISITTPNPSPITTPNPSPIKTPIPSSNSFFSLLPVLLLGLGIIVFALRLIAMQQGSTLYYGSGNGLWEVTAKTLLNKLVNSNYSVSEVTLGALIIVISIGGLFFLLNEFKLHRFNFRKLDLLSQPAFIFTFLFFGNCFAAILLNKMLHVNYPEDRVGLYFLPLFIGSLSFVLDGLIKRGFPRYSCMLIFPLLFLPIHFLKSINLTHTSFYSEENIPHRFYTKIAQDYLPTGSPNQANRPFPPTIGGYRMRQLAWNYQNFQHGGNLGLLSCQNHPQSNSDFQMTVTKDLGQSQSLYETIDYDTFSNLSLLKRKSKLKRLQLIDTVLANSEINAEFTDLFTVKVDTLGLSNLLLGTQCSIQSTAKPLLVWLVVTATDSAGKQIYYESLPLDWMKTTWKGDFHNFSTNIQIHQLPKDSKWLKCYFWNRKRSEFLLKDGSFTLCKLM